MIISLADVINVFTPSCSFHAFQSHPVYLFVTELANDAIFDFADPFSFMEGYFVKVTKNTNSKK